MIVFSHPLLMVVIVLLLIVYLKTAYKKPTNFPPGPPRLPGWGNYWFFLKENYNHLHIAFEKVAKRYNTDILGVYLGNFPTVVTLSHELSKELLNRDEFIGRPDTITIRSRNLGELKGVLFANEQFWKEQRRFSLRYMRDYGFGRRSTELENFMLDEVKYLIDLLNSEPYAGIDDICKGKGQILIPDAFYGSLLNMIFQVLASTRFDYYKLRQVARAGMRVLRSGDATGSAISMTPWLRFIAPDFFGYTSAVKDNAYMHDFIKEILDEHIKTFSDDYHRDYIDVFLSENYRAMKEDNEIALDYKQLLLTVLDYMFPAAIGIGNVLSFYFAHLINHRDVQNKIQDEIDRIVGHSRLPNLDDRKLMPYTEATIRENIRILPLNPLGIARRCIQDTTLGGYFIPKDTIMLPCIWTAHRDPSVWTKPEMFNPERFLDEQGNLLKKDLTMAFGNGKRLCAGETFSGHTMFLIITGILQNYKIRALNGKRVDLNKLTPGFGLSIDNNWIKVIPR